MGRMIFVLPDDLEMAFRKKVMDQTGGKHGSLSVKLGEAVQDWIKKQK